MRNLSNGEIEEVKEILMDRHPLYYQGFTITDIFPILKKIPFLKQSKKSKLLPNNIQKSDAPDLKMGKSSSYRAVEDMNENEKNLNTLGYGLTAYFELKRNLMIIFLIMFVLLLPSLILFVYYPNGRKSGSSFLNKFSVGNLGFSSALCKDVSLKVGNLTMSCPTGQMGKLISFGIMPRDAKDNDAGLPNHETREGEDSFDQEDAKSEIENKGIGHGNCTVDGNKFIRAVGQSKGISPYAQFYIQMYGMHNHEELIRRDWLNILFGCQVIVTTLAYLTFIIILDRENRENYRLWDMMTSTISNYTVKYKIPNKVFDTFVKKREEMNFLIDENLMYAFKDYLRYEIEKILGQQPHVNVDDNKLIKIANIGLSFNYRDLYDMLEKRGAAIQDSDVNDINKHEKEIISYIAENSEDICRPLQAYIVFETDEAMRRALELKNNSSEEQVKWNGKKLKLMVTSEPSNIEFKHKYQSSKKMCGKKIIVLAILLSLLTFIGYLIFVIMDSFNKLNRIYPEIECDDVISESNQEMMRDYAMVEYFNFENSDKSEESLMKINTDNLQCFGEQSRDDKGIFDAMQRTYHISKWSTDMEGAICKDYLRSSVFIELLDYLIPMFIFCTDWILGYVASIGIGWIGYWNRTVELSRNQTAVFLMTFFNMALAILLINARFDKQPKNHFLFNGVYTDFSDDWYDESSEFFVTPTFMEISTPFIWFIYDYVLQNFAAFMDRRFTDQKLYKTQGNSANEYADINSGTENCIIDKYPWTLCIVVVACFYGFSLPLLPIAVFIGLVITYIFEKVAAIWYHRRPPLYDQTLNKDSIFFLRWGSFLYAAIAYWVLTNKQMFDNVLNPISYRDQIEDYNHYVFEMPPRIQQKILLVFSLALFVVLFFYDIVYRFIISYYAKHVEDESKDIEHLSNFSESLKKKDIDFLIKEEEERRDVFRYKVLFNDFTENLSHTFKSRKDIGLIKRDSSWDPELGYLTDSVSYDPLDQQDYALMFGYVPVYRRRLTHLGINKDSQFTRLVMDFPFHQNLELIKEVAKPVDQNDEENKS